MTEQGKTLTLTKMAKYLGIPKTTLYDMIREKRFNVEPIKGSNPRLWNIEDVDAWRGKPHD